MKQKDQVFPRLMAVFLLVVTLIGMLPLGALAVDVDEPPTSVENVTEDPGSTEVTEASTPAPADPTDAPDDTMPDSTEPTDANDTQIPSPTDEAGASIPTAPNDEFQPQDPSLPTIPSLTSPDPDENGQNPAMPLADNNGGSSGSDIGGGDGAGDAVTPPPGVQGGGNLLWTAPGITMQVVLFPYGETYDRNLSYNNVIDVVQTYKNGSTQTVYDGFSTTSSTFVADLTTGRVYRIPHYNPADKTFAFRGGYRSGTGAAGITIHPGVNNCVSGPATVVNGPREQTVTMPVMNDIEAFLQHIILGNAVGAWDKLDVCMDINGNSLDNWDRSDPSSAPTSADDYSLFARVLRYLGVEEEYINNYVLGYTGQLDKIDDHDVLIPTIIWSYCIAESTTAPVTDTGDGAMPFYYNDPSSTIADNTYFLSSKPYEDLYNYWLTGRVYTVGDMFNSSATALRVSDPVDKFNAWWKTDFAQGEGGSSPTTQAYNAAIGGCGWDTTSSYACNFLFGQYHRNGMQHGYTQDRNYCQYANASGFVNRINAQGVDNSSGTLYYYRGYWTPYGWKEPEIITGHKVSLQKSIDATSDCISQLQGNPLYSLAGAEYGIYKNGVLQETLITDANGHAVSTKEYEVGTVLSVVELKAPSGYRLDTTEYVLTVSEGTNEFKVKDEPIFDPPFALTKIDKDTTNPQGNSSFSGAVFKWEYFPNYDWSGTAERTWYFTTNDSGRAEYKPVYLAPGYTSDAMFVSSSGEYEIPLGSVKITEVKNSLGYTVIPTPLYVSIVIDPSSSTGAKFVWTAESLKLLTNISAGNYGVVEPEDKSTYGSFTLEKIDEDTKTNIPQGNASLAGAVFEVVNNSTNSVKIGDFAEAQPGSVCFEFTVGADGTFSSGKIFPIGSYTIREKKAPTGYLLDPDWSFIFEVTYNSDAIEDVKVICEEPPVRGGIKIIKQDADLGADTGPDAKLDGITYSIISNSTNPVEVNGKIYSKGTTVMTLEIKWDGTNWSASTGANVLPYGNYIVRENPMTPGSDMANEYYHLNNQDQPKDVTSNGVEVTVTFTNIPKEEIFGSFILEKVDAETGKGDPQGGATLAGAKFKVYNTGNETVKIGNFGEAGQGQVCYEFELDSHGRFESEAIFPEGSYTIMETEAPTGYKLDPSWFETFVVTSSNTFFPFTIEEDEACPNEVIRGGLTIIKQDKDLGNATGEDAGLEGITFSVINANENPVKVDGILYAKGETVLTLEIQWDGTQWSVSSASDALPYGKYIVKENPMEDGSNMANEDFYLNMEPQEITISEEHEFVSVTFENELKIIPGKIVIYKVDPVGNSLAGAKFLLEWSEDGINWQPVEYYAEERPYKGSCGTEGLTDGWLITDSTGVIEFENLFVGLYYRVTELEAPEGYVLLTDYAFQGTLTEAEATAELTIVNSPGFGLPTTGSVGAKLHATIGAFLLVSGLLCMFALLVNNVSVFYSRTAMNKTKRHTKERK